MPTYVYRASLADLTSDITDSTGIVPRAVTTIPVTQISVETSEQLDQNDKANLDTFMEDRGLVFDSEI